MLTNIESFRDYCLEKKAVTESFPFDESTLVFKVAGKMFALTSLDSEEFRVNLKCLPEKSELLREAYPENILPGFHMNKKHWNTVIVDEKLPKNMLEELTEHSYQLVVQSLTKKSRMENRLE